MRIRHMAREHNLPTELRDQAVMRLDWRGNVLGVKREQGGVGGVEHRVVSAIACAVGVARRKQERAPASARSAFRR